MPAGAGAVRGQLQPGAGVTGGLGADRQLKRDYQVASAALSAHCVVQALCMIELMLQHCCHATLGMKGIMLRVVTTSVD